MLEFGSNLGMPHTKFLEDGLIELRVKGKEGIARVFYCTLIGKRIRCFIPILKNQTKHQRKKYKSQRKE